ncbi:FadR/GntR family transcriptional regulator [Patulibacter defluvii]|uniref:FadR/GntR family transcriptional regulator n=1 Tax=Patulibacter defluvii TaxID=3095358 RepID=UPI002A765CA0|nr:FCD domain-containing protein [Patulibacter sp. DM4]
MTTTGGPVLVPAAYAVVVQHLRRAIHLGTYGPGEKLPPEREHAEQLGVSRVTLREALRVLEGEGYLEMRRGSAGGAIVTGPPSSEASRREYLRDHLDDVLAIQQFRLAIEPLSAARAAERRTPEALEQLRQAVADLSDADSLGRFRRADTSFHLTLADSADCPPLRRAIEDARIEMFDQLDVVDFDIVLANAIEGHGAILERVAAGDPDGARRAMEAHVSELRQEILQLVASFDR